ncbi:MAG TPA: metallophosphoesterase [Sphingobacterium sp.]|nr:metallophosphoesterase [Sphingobacterium sp.]
MQGLHKGLVWRLLVIILFLIVNPFLGCAPKKDLHGVPSYAPWFQIAVLPDTQCYVSGKFNGKMEDFEQQIEWVKQNQKVENIAYVVHLGDISQNGEKELIEWERARNVMYRLEEPLPGMPDGIPYGVAVGNHDTTPIGMPLRMENGYKKSFGRSHFLEKSYYGGSIYDREENDCHYDLFEAAGQKFIVLYMAFNQPSKKHYDKKYDDEMFAWGGKVLKQYTDRKAIIVCHSVLGRPAGSQSDYKADVGNGVPQSKFTSQGKNVYAFAKHYPNVFMMLCGHVSGEGYRVDTYDGRTIKSYLADYSSRRHAPYREEDSNGGNGLMRLMKINTSKNTLEVRTIAPRKDGNHVWEEDEDSKFTHPLYR